MTVCWRLDESAEVIVRQLKKMRNGEARGKLVAELRSLEKMSFPASDPPGWICEETKKKAAVKKAR